MNKLVKIQLKYIEILDHYHKKYNFNQTINGNFEELKTLFMIILKKQVNGEIVIIDKRDEFDILRAILTQISGEFTKLISKNLEDRYTSLFQHRDKVSKLLLISKFKFPKKEIKDPVVIDKPDYGYHKDFEKFDRTLMNAPYFEEIN